MTGLSDKPTDRELKKAFRKTAVRETILFLQFLYNYFYVDMLFQLTF